MDQVQNKKYDLGERTLQLAKDVRIFSRNLPRTISNIEDVKQLIRSSGSIGANYIEACECLSKKDFLMRIKISRKEAKESVYWLSLIDCPMNQKRECDRLIQESTELMKIFGSIVSKG